MPTKSRIEYGIQMRTQTDCVKLESQLELRSALLKAVGGRWGVEALAAAAHDYGLAITGEETRRNLLTCGIALNHLVGRKFRIGDVLVRGLKLCEPCEHLEKLTGKKVIKALRHRGGLRAEILTDGLIKVGDVITQVE